MAARLGRNKLTEIEIKRIKEMILMNIPTTDIAKRFNCSLNPIRLIKKNMKVS